MGLESIVTKTVIVNDGLRIDASRLFRTFDPWMAKYRSTNVILVDDVSEVCFHRRHHHSHRHHIVDLKQQNKKSLS